MFCFHHKEMDDGLKEKITKIPLMSTRAGPRDGDLWVTRLKVNYHFFKDMRL
jgi:hypothetical protein